MSFATFISKSLPQFAVGRRAFVAPTMASLVTVASLITVASLATEVDAAEVPSTRTADRPIGFRQHILPWLLDRCLGCHDAETAEGGYRVDSWGSLMRAGDSGLTALTPKRLSESELWQRITSHDPDKRMPADSDPLPDAELRMVRLWIQQGLASDGIGADTPLAAIRPIPVHPDAPEFYRNGIPITAIHLRGSQIQIGGYHELLVWDWSSGQLQQRIPQVGQRVRRLLQIDATSIIASGSPGRLGELRIIRIDTPSSPIVPISTSDMMLDAEISPDGSRLAVASADKKIYIVDLQSNQLMQTIDSHSDWVHAIAWHPDGYQLVSASRDRTSKIFDIETGRPMQTYADHAQPVTDARFASADQVISCSETGEVHLWKVADAKRERIYKVRGTQLHPGPAGTLLFGDSPMIAQLAIDQDDPTRFWKWTDAPSALPQNLSGSPNIASPNITAVAFDGQYLAAGSLDGRVAIWKLRDQQPVVQFTPFPQAGENQRQPVTLTPE